VIHWEPACPGAGSQIERGERQRTAWQAGVSLRQALQVNGIA